MLEAPNSGLAIFTYCNKNAYVFFESRTFFSSNIYIFLFWYFDPAPAKEIISNVNIIKKANFKIHERYC